MLSVAATVAAAVLDDLSVTASPPVGAGPVSVTVPVLVAAPPTTLVGDTDSDCTVTAAIAGVTVSEAVFVEEPIATVMVTVLLLETLLPVTWKEMLLLPAAIVTEEGTVAEDVSEDLSVMVAPPAGAAAERVTLPRLVWPAMMLGGVSVRLLSVTRGRVDGKGFGTGRADIGRCDRHFDVARRRNQGSRNACRQFGTVNVGSGKRGAAKIHQ